MAASKTRHFLWYLYYVSVAGSGDDGFVPGLVRQGFCQAFTTRVGVRARRGGGGSGYVYASFFFLVPEDGFHVVHAR